MEPSSNKSAALAGTIGLGDLTVNRLGFGAMRQCGDSAWGRPRDRGHANRVLHRAVELGVNFIDTADSYGPETNESLISQAPLRRGHRERDVCTVFGQQSRSFS